MSKRKISEASPIKKKTRGEHLMAAVGLLTAASFHLAATTVHLANAAVSATNAVSLAQRGLQHTQDALADPAVPTVIDLTADDPPDEAEEPSPKKQRRKLTP